MNSEFANLVLDQVRYSLVWEDSRTLHAALAIGPADHVLVVTSAGCNVLNALLAGPRQVTAIDLNPVQNALLQLKCHLIAHHEPEALRALSLPPSSPSASFAGPLLGKKYQGFGQQSFLGLEMEIHQSTRQTRLSGDLGQRHPGKATFGQHLDRRFDQLPATRLTAHLAGRR